ncbi:MAG: peroxiredoxin family protein [Pseudonocardia sp.]|nr:peroxiredoxin family protein [Pseudonocardia sp.]
MILGRRHVSRAEFEHGTGWALRPLVHDTDAGLWALGPAAPGGQVLVSAQAPELTLPDLDGVEFALSPLRSRKVVLVAWAPY